MGKTSRELHPRAALDADGLRDCGFKEVNLNKLWRHVVAGKGNTWRDIPRLPAAMFDTLEKDYTAITSRVTLTQHSDDGVTTKLLVCLQDGAEIETVIIRHGKHNTVCVSSQVGCRMGCKFCATGTMGLLSNLTAAEILEQVYHANQVVPIRNVVFMGMGEPLDNFDAVTASIQGMENRHIFSLSRHNITVSTVGMVGRIRRLADKFPTVQLALSLHATTQELREKIIPTSTANTIPKLLDAIKYYNTTTGNRVCIQYTVIENVNADERHAHELVQLLQGCKVMVNLIPYNATDVPGRHAEYREPSQQCIYAFRDAIKSYGVLVWVRNTTTSGRNVSGACGQLRIDHAKRDANSDNSQQQQAPNGLADIEELGPRAGRKTNNHNQDHDHDRGASAARHEPPSRAEMLAEEARAGAASRAWREGRPAVHAHVLVGLVGVLCAGMFLWWSGTSVGAVV